MGLSPFLLSFPSLLSFSPFLLSLLSLLSSSKPNFGCNMFASKKTVSIVFTTFFTIHEIYNLMGCIQITSFGKDFCQNVLVSTGSIQEEFQPIIWCIPLHIRVIEGTDLPPHRLSDS